MKNKLIIISAPSGAGKTTLVKYLLDNFKELEFSISCTTREKRGLEIHGKDYYFLSNDEFKQNIENQKFIEYEEVYHGTFYGTLKSELNRIWAKNKTIIFDVDVEGGANLKQKFLENSLAIFISPPNLETLKNRLINRNTDSEEVIKYRLEKSKYEMTFSSKFDKILINDNLEIAKKEILELINIYLKS